MSTQRPTFHESWYRVSQMCPRLRAGVDIQRQRFRGQIWHVVHDPVSQQFYRLNGPAYRFVGLLNGHRSIAEVWDECNRILGDDAPTQGEAVALLGQLYTSNLLTADLPGDTEAVFRRFRKRIGKEWQGRISGFLAVRIPILDPDRVLDAMVRPLGWVFSGWGMVVWSILMLVGLWHLAGHEARLVAGAGSVLAPENLPLLYVAFIVSKTLHEFAHGLACKVFGKRAGTGGEVHAIGIMLLVLLPVPYCDASSSWMLRNKWQRVIVGAAGMFIETAVGAVAAVVWARTAEGTLVNALAYNTIFSVGVSTLLFNANPLLRYDGYYILSDILEVANLQQRSRDYLYYLVKRYVWDVQTAQTPAHLPEERWLLGVYGVASTFYRMLITFSIILFVADQLFFVGVLLAVATLAAWIVLPLARLVGFIIHGAELERVRRRVIWTSLAAVMAIVAGVGAVPFPDRVRLAGVVEAQHKAVIRMPADGTIVAAPAAFSTAGHDASSPGMIIAQDESQERNAQLIRARLTGLEARRRKALVTEPAAAQAIARQIEAVEDSLGRIQRDLESLTIRAPFSGVWIPHKGADLVGRRVPRGAELGTLVDAGRMSIRAVAEQAASVDVVGDGSRLVDVRVQGRPDLQCRGTIEAVVPAGRAEMPAESLGFSAGGSVRQQGGQTEARRSAERLFEVHIAPDGTTPLFPGQRVVVRLDTGSRPLAAQAARWLRRILQQRFQV